MRPPTSRAFSLIEIVIVVAIIAAITAVAVPKYISSLNNYRVKGAAQSVASLILEAQARARASSSQSRIVVSGNSIAELDASGATVRELSLNTQTLKASVHRYVLGGDAILVFNGYGAPDTTGSIQLVSGPVSCKVTVAADGRVQVSDVSTLALEVAESGPVDTQTPVGSESEDPGGINVDLGPIDISLGGKTLIQLN
jgi:prepilin-type N-terminal cleavage/methylation domain-containing protein